MSKNTKSKSRTANGTKPVLYAVFINNLKNIICVHFVEETTIQDLVLKPFMFTIETINI